MGKNQITEKIYFIGYIDETSKENEDYSAEWVLFLRFNNSLDSETILEDPILENLIKEAKQSDAHLQCLIKDIDEDIEDFLEDKDMFSTEKGELYYYCHIYRIAFDKDFNVIESSAPPKETVELFEYIEKEYKKLNIENN